MEVNMDKPENGLYVARITDDGAKAMHADENAVCDAQTDRMFKDRDKERETLHKEVKEAQERANKAAAKRKRKLLYLAKDCLSLGGTAFLVMLTYRFGQMVAIAAVTGCIVAAMCRVMNYLERSGN
jgi:hypothetical protein